MTLMEHLGSQVCGLAVGGPAQTSQRLDSNPSPLAPKVTRSLSFVACIRSMPTSEGSWVAKRMPAGKGFKTEPVSSQLVVIVPYGYYFALVSLFIFFTFLQYLYL